MIKVLFLCTGNACRSQMAEGLVNHDFADRIRACSAGTRPGRVSELAARVLAEIGIDISSHSSKHVDTFADREFDYLITLCGDAEQNCPHFPGQGKRLHLGFPDPPHTNEPSAENLRIYRQTRDAIRTTLQDFFNKELGME